MRRAGAQAQPTLDQGKAMAQDLSNRAFETGREAVGRAGEFLQGVSPQAKQVADNLYEQGSQSGEYLRQYVATTPQRIADCWRNRVHARLSDPPPVITEVSVFDRSQHVAGLIIPGGPATRLMRTRAELRSENE